MDAKVLTYQGKETGKTANLADDIFGIEPNDHAIYLDVKQYLAKKRRGTHKAKERGEIIGSRKKIKRQKGTGTARAGDIKNPIYRGGGRVFGPRVRDYSFKLNKKLKRIARKSALAYKAQEGGIKVLEDFTFEAPRTKNYQEMLKNLSVDNKKSLLVLSEQDDNINLSGRNIPNAEVKVANELNTYDIMNAKHLLISENALTTIEEIFNKDKKKTA